MCEPFSATASAAAATGAASSAAALSTFQIASLALTGISGLTSLIGSQQQAAQEAKALKYQAAVDNNNKIIQERQAADAISRGKNEEMLHRIKIGQLKGQQVNAFAKNGVEVDSGSALDVLSDTAQIGELEALTIRSNAARDAYGYQVNAMNYDASAKNNLAAAKNVKKSATMSGVGTVLSTAGSVSDKWYKYKNGG